MKMKMDPHSVKNMRGGCRGYFRGGFQSGIPGGFPGGFQGDFTGGFQGGFSRGFPGGFQGDFPERFPGGFQMGFSRGFQEEFPGVFQGGFSRGFPGEFQGYFPEGFSGKFQGDFPDRFQGGFSGGSSIRGMMRDSWNPHLQSGTQLDKFPFEFGPSFCRGSYGRGGSCRFRHRRGFEGQKKKSGSKNEDEIVIDGSSDETSEDECENIETDAFEVHVNMRGCDPDTIKISIKDGVLKIEGKTKSSDANSIFVSHEQAIPDSVSLNNLKAFLYPNGLLFVSEMQGVVSVQIKAEKEILMENLSIS